MGNNRFNCLSEKLPVEFSWIKIADIPFCLREFQTQCLWCTADGANSSRRIGRNWRAAIQGLFQQVTALRVIVALVLQAVDEYVHRIGTILAQAFHQARVGEKLLAAVDGVGAIYGAVLEHLHGYLALRVSEIERENTMFSQSHLCGVTVTLKVNQSH